MQRPGFLGEENKFGLHFVKVVVLKTVNDFHKRAPS